MKVTVTLDHDDLKKALVEYLADNGHPPTKDNNSIDVMVDIDGDYLKLFDLIGPNITIDI